MYTYLPCILTYHVYLWTMTKQGCTLNVSPVWLTPYSCLCLIHYEYLDCTVSEHSTYCVTDILTPSWKKCIITSKFIGLRRVMALFTWVIIKRIPWFVWKSHCISVSSFYGKTLLICPAISQISVIFLMYVYIHTHIHI